MRPIGRGIGCHLTQACPRIVSEINDGTSGRRGDRGAFFGAHDFLDARTSGDSHQNPSHAKCHSDWGKRVVVAADEA